MNTSKSSYLSSHIVNPPGFLFCFVCWKSLWNVKIKNAKRMARASALSWIDFPFPTPLDVDVDVTQLLLLVLPSINAERRQHVRDLFHISAKGRVYLLVMRFSQIDESQFSDFPSLWFHLNRLYGDGYAESCTLAPDRWRGLSSFHPKNLLSYTCMFRGLSKIPSSLRNIHLHWAYGHPVLSPCMRPCIHSSETEGVGETCTGTEEFCPSWRVFIPNPCF